MEKITDLLKKTGLNSKEIKLYLTGLKFGSQPASVIARQTQLNRITAYAILKNFVKKGLAKTIIKRGVQFFTVISPAELVDYAKRRSEEWNNISKETVKLIPDFLQYGPYSENLPKVSFYEGVEGIKEVYNDTLKNTDEILGFLTVEHIHPELREYFIKNYTPRRIREKIKCRMILSYSERAKKYQKSDRKYLRKTYLLPKKQMPFETEISIYGKDKTAIIAFTTAAINAVIIQNQAIHNTLKSIFYFCEKMAK